MEPRTRFDPQGVEGGDEPRSLGELFRALSADAATLVRQEIALARAEVAQNARSLAGNAGKIVVGAVLAGVGALVLVFALVAGLGELLGERYWLSALIVGAVFLAAGGFLLLNGIRGARRHPVAPTETLETLRETGDWAKGEVSGLRAALLGGAADGSGDGNGRRLPPSPVSAKTLARADGGSSRAAERESTRVDRGGDGAKTPPQARGAGSPARSTGEPPLEWPLWKRVWTSFKDDDIGNQAAKVAYYFFLSLPPLMMAVFGLAGLFGGDDTADWLSRQLGGNLPAEAGRLVNDFVTDIVHKEHPGPLSIGLLLAVWAGSNVFMALEDTLNTAYGVRCERGFVKRRAVALGTLLAVGLLFVAGSAAILAGPALARAAGLGRVGETVWGVAQWPLGFALVVGAFWVIYYVLPNKDQRAFKRVLLRSSALAAALWVLATLAFRVYVAHFGSYSATYGLLGAVIVLLLWMYYTSLVILLGGEISSEMERSA